MARFASDSNRGIMPVGVTRNALRTQALERCVRVGVENSGDIRITDVLRDMALVAFGRFVSADKEKPGFRVVKLRFVEFCDLRVASEMLLMTGFTGVPRIRKMKSVTALDLTVDLDVTRQALRTADPLTALVTLCAV